MSLQQIPPKPTGNNWINWAQRLSAYLIRIRSLLRHKTDNESAKDNGIILWDEENGYPIVSKDNVFRQVLLADGYGTFYVDSDVTPAAADTAYPINFTDTIISNGISVGTPASRLVVDEAGFYLVTFTVNISSSDSSAKTLRFWPKLNGVDVPNYTIAVTIKDNSAAITMTRDALVQLAAGDYIEAYYATDTTNAKLSATAATSYAPAGASVMVSVMRIRQ